MDLVFLFYVLEIGTNLFIKCCDQTVITVGVVKCSRLYFLVLYFAQVLTGFLNTNSWLNAIFFNQMMVITEFSTKEKNMFLWRVIRWQLKLLQ